MLDGVSGRVVDVAQGAVGEQQWDRACDVPAVSLCGPGSRGSRRAESLSVLGERCSVRRGEPVGLVPGIGGCANRWCGSGEAVALVVVGDGCGRPAEGELCGLVGCVVGQCCAVGQGGGVPCSGVGVGGGVCSTLATGLWWLNRPSIQRSRCRPTKRRWARPCTSRLSTFRERAGGLRLCRRQRHCRIERSLRQCGWNGRCGPGSAWNRG